MKIKFTVFITFLALACRPDLVIKDKIASHGLPENVTFIEFKIPPGFTEVRLPKDNPLTEEGVRLGRHLFYEKRLSGDKTMSCGSCHNQEFSFTDNGNALSTGISGAVGQFNSMPLFNLAWHNFFFWDGRAKTLEEQVLEPIENPKEMNNSWENALGEISKDPLYDQLFTSAFWPKFYNKGKCRQSTGAIFKNHGFGQLCLR